MLKGTVSIPALLAALLILAAMVPGSARAGEEAPMGRFLGPGVNLRVDVGLEWTETAIEPYYASGTKTPVSLDQAKHNAEYWASSLEVPIKVSLELHPYFRVFGKLGYLESGLQTEWLSGSAFVASGDPNEQSESADLEPGFRLGFGAEGAYPIDVFRIALAYHLSWGRSAIDHQSFHRVNVSGDFSILTHRFFLTVGTKFRFLTPYIGVGGQLVYAAGAYHEHLPAGSTGTAGNWRVRYKETIPLFLMIGLDSEVGEGTAGFQFRFLGEFHAEFYLGLRI